jgi:hypothetical protein
MELRADVVEVLLRERTGRPNQTNPNKLCPFVVDPREVVVVVSPHADKATGNSFSHTIKTKTPTVHTACAAAVAHKSSFLAAVEVPSPIVVALPSLTWATLPRALYRTIQTSARRITRTSHLQQIWRDEEDIGGAAVVAEVSVAVADLEVVERYLLLKSRGARAVYRG